MRPLNIRFPSSDAKIISVLESALVGWAGLVVDRKFDTVTDRRFIAVRNDSGPQELVQSRRRYGFNVWADSSADAENIALDAMAALSVAADGNPVTLVDSFSGPYEVDDEPIFVVGGKNMSHFYFTARVSVRGL